MGLFAPGFKTLGIYFQNMWKEASSDREKWGCKFLSIPLSPKPHITNKPSPQSSANPTT